MLSLFGYVGKYLWRTYNESYKSDDDKDKETLNDYLESKEKEENENNKKQTTILPQTDNECIQCTGRITVLNANGGLIDDKVNFTTENLTHLRLKVNSFVLYYAFKSTDPNIISGKILKVISHWSDDEKISTENLPAAEIFDIIQRDFVAKVIGREGRNVTVEVDNIKFNLDKVKSDFIPVEGDYVILTAKVGKHPESVVNTRGELLEVIAMSPLRNDLADGIITMWNKESKIGVIDNKIFFSALTCDFPFVLEEGNKVTYKAVESDQGEYTWRAVSIVLITAIEKSKHVIKSKPVEVEETKFGIEISKNFDIALAINEKKSVNVIIKNISKHPQTFSKLIFLSKYSESQLKNISIEKGNVNLKPSECMTLTFECCAKIMGFSDEKVLLCFVGFKIIRIFKINVINSNCYPRKMIKSNRRQERMQSLLTLKNRHEQSSIPGVKNFKSAPFINVRIPIYVIPKKLWDEYYELSKEYNREYSLSSSVVLQPLTIDNYKEIFHTLMYFEEIHNTILFRNYDMKNAFMIKSGECLILEIEGLSERRPCLQTNDYVNVKNPWNADSPLFEGNIQKINGNNVFLRFCNSFHTQYNGEDLDVEFFFAKTNFRRCHFAIDLAFSTLGSRLLFPNCVEEAEEPQIEIDESQETPIVTVKSIVVKNKQSIVEVKKQKMIWYNENLNIIQKRSVVNVLKGILRPMPYVIFGPPGTGKTVTMVENIMQILSLVLNARLLIATPSNSSANLITQRLIESSDCTPGCLVRLVSLNQLENNKIPDELKPFCATLDIASENSVKSRSHIDENGLHHFCSKSYIGRHPITIGTCMCLASLARLGFPAGHFTHIFVDEAGQCTEPEIMTVLSFANKPTTQIILSGDPLQLGPVVTSELASKCGLEKSYLERLLNSVPYKKDIAGNGIDNEGYDPRLITKLTFNYRSIQKIISLSSDLFYNGSLISQVDPESPVNKKYFERLKSIIDLPENPGIIFYGIRGENFRVLESPSWYNPQEASSILYFLLRLYAKGIEPDDIGIITPYKQQVKFIHSLINDEDVPVPKIGSVEEFQGQERKIILLSTVRSQKDYIKSDLEKQLGFVKLPKRVNVAISRAQILLVIFGNPHLLLLDPLWRNIILRVIKEYCYKGCDLPDLEELDT